MRDGLLVDSHFLDMFCCMMYFHFPVGFCSIRRVNHNLYLS